MIRELEPSEIDRPLHSEIMGRIGFHSRRRTDVVPITYVIDGTSIIVHTGLPRCSPQERPLVIT